VDRIATERCGHAVSACFLKLIEPTGYSEATRSILTDGRSSAEIVDVTKKEIVKQISEDIGLTQLKTKEVIQRTLDAIIESLVSEGRIELRNVGAFEVKRRAPRLTRNRSQRLTATTAEIHLSGQVDESLILPKLLDRILQSGGSFEVQKQSIGATGRGPSSTRLAIDASSPEELDSILNDLAELGVTEVVVDSSQVTTATREPRDSMEDPFEERTLRGAERRPEEASNPPREPESRASNPPLKAHEHAPVASEEETTLLLRINAGISSGLRDRTAALIEKRDAEGLTEQESREFLDLADEIERRGVERLEAMSRLAELRGVPLRELSRSLGITVGGRG